LDRFRIRVGDVEVEYEGEEAAKKYEELIGSIKSHLTVKDSHSLSGAGGLEAKPPIIQHPLVGPRGGKLGILEFGKDEVKFPVDSIDKLSFTEAIGLLLGELGESATPERIQSLLNKGFRKVSLSYIKDYLTKPKYTLPKYVIKEGDGYRLTAEGEAWVKNDITPKTKLPANSK
jgi:hypothetical protein